MPITVTGKTDTTGAISVVPMAEKSVCILGQVSGTPTDVATELEVFDVFSTSDIVKKLGKESKAFDIAKILIANGVTQIKAICVPETGSTYSTASEAYGAALDVLMAYDVDLLSLDTMDTAIMNVLTDHLDLAEGEDKFRYAVVSTAGSSILTISTFANTINHSRVMVVGTEAVDENAVAVGPHVLSAGVTATIIKEMKDPALPMNSVEIKGLGGVGKVLQKSECNALVNAGVTPIVKAQSGRPSIYRLVTSSKDDAVWQEATTRFIADDVLSSCQNRIKANYKRTKNVARILKAMRTDIISVLQAKEDLEIIENFDPNTVTVIKDPTDNYGAIIEYEFDVVTPLYTVTINQHLKL